MDENGEPPEHTRDQDEHDYEDANGVTNESETEETNADTTIIILSERISELEDTVRDLTGTVDELNARLRERDQRPDASNWFFRKIF